jgi:hypothetical protein
MNVRARGLKEQERERERCRIHTRPARLLASTNAKHARPVQHLSDRIADSVSSTHQHNIYLVHVSRRWLSSCAVNTISITYLYLVAVGFRLVPLLIKTHARSRSTSVSMSVCLSVSFSLSHKHPRSFSLQLPPFPNRRRQQGP